MLATPCHHDSRPHTQTAHRALRWWAWFVAALVSVHLGALAQSLSITPNGANVVVSWSDPSAVLLRAFEIDGPWAVVEGAASPYQVAPDEDHQFYRLYFPSG